MTNKEIIDKILQDEGYEYTNDPIDSGGATKYGITLKDYRQYHSDATEEDIKNLSQQEAEGIYVDEYINKTNYIQIKNDFIRYSLIDFAVNSGVSRANKEIQKILNDKYNCNISIDGISGSNTIIAINENAGISLFFDINFIRMNFLINFVKNNPSQMRFMSGWMNRVMRIIQNNVNYF